jgi:hypothetical protein
MALSADHQNDGNRVNAPIKGVIRWNRREAQFSTNLEVPTTTSGSIGTKEAVQLEPDEMGRIIVDVWTDLKPGEKPSGDQKVRITIVDRYGEKHNVKEVLTEIVPQPDHATTTEDPRP